MKKSKGNQATLFQTSWGHSAQSTSRNPNSNRNEPNTSQAHMGAFSVFDPNEMVELEDDEDDDELLAAAEGIVPFDEAKFRAKYNGGGQAKATNISCNPDDGEVIPGFDLEAGNVWIYPTNYPIRNYQYNIVEQALFKNTLVTLPTGLGKTFIAAVIMYNFYRWYPQGKVIFMAPTKPLVAQQIEACYNIMGIPQSDTAEMTGNMAPNKRQSMWQSRRVFFLTPQVLQNDLNRGSCKAEEVVLLVADEAHKALGNHAYCQVVREISGYTRNFRVLALSATPGDNPEAVQQVITNLLISHMELRSEESPDIKPYTHSRLVEKVVVSLGEDIAKVKNSFLKILDTIVGRLFSQRVLWNSDPQRVSKFMLLTARDQYRKRMNEQGGFDRNRQGLIEGDFAMCISLYHAYELLLQHGILSFYNFIKAIIDGTKGMARAKTEITKNHEFTQLMDELREEIEPPMESGANESLLFSQFSPRRRALMNVPKPSTTFKSHPKLLKLKEIVLEHFDKFQDKSGEEKKGVATRVMIFSQYRDSVNEIAAMLSHHKPVVRAMSFIGQQSTGKSTRGLTQKEQLQVVQRFRQGGYNTLVATCVGEEGLDIGEVDLIVCFDAHASPIRLVQRMGRTGRKRDGRIVILVTEGKEEQVYMKSQRSKKSIHKAVTQAAKSFDLYTDNHRMVPRQITPAVLKMEMTVGKFVGQSKGKKEKRPSDGANIKKFTTKSLTTSSKKSNGFLTYEELVYWQEKFKLPEHEAGLSPQLSVTKKSRRSLSDAKKPVTQISLSEWLPWQTTPHAVKAVTHSRRTEHLIELLEFTELQGGRGDDDVSYDLEMMSFLNEDDILKLGQKEEDAQEIIVFEIDPDVACEENEGTRKITKKAKKTRKKLQMEDKTDAENDGQSSRKESKGENGTTAKKKSKGLKKRSPENKARWKAFLNQFDDQEDKDFESDSANAAVVPDGDKAVDDCLQREDGETFNDDLPDIGDPWKPDDKPSGVDKNHVRLNDSNEPIASHMEITSAQEGEGDDLSDAASDEMTNLFPAVTPHSQGSVPGFQLQNERFPLVMASVPTPPSLDALDKISLSSVDAELPEFNMDFEEIQRKYFGEKQYEKDVMDKSEAVSPNLSPNVCFEGDLEPFLVADFLQDDERNTDAETSEMSRDERNGPVSSTSHCPSETANKTYSDQSIRRDARYPDSENQSTKDKYGNSECDLRVVAEECNNGGGTKDHDTRGISNDTVADVSCGSPIKGEDTTIGEGFFMDVTDEDDAFANITLLGDDKIGVNDTKSNKHQHTDKQDLFMASEWVRNESKNVSETDVNGPETRLGTSKQVGKSNLTAAGQSRTSGDIDLAKSISKLSAFQRCPANNQDTHSEKEKIGVLKKREGTLSIEARSTLPLHEVRTRGEHSNSNALQSEVDVGMLLDIRNSGAAPPLTTNLSNKDLSSKPGTKPNNLTGAFRDELPYRDSESERPDRKSHLTGLTSRGRVENETGDATCYIGNNVSLNCTIKHRDKEGNIGDNTGNNIGDNTGNNIGDNTDNNIGDNTGNNIGDNTDNNIGDNTGNNIGDNTGNNIGDNTGNNIGDNTGNNINDNTDNACRTPLPKKRKLSLKRTSPKDKGMPAAKKQGKTSPVNEAKSLDFGASRSLLVNQREENFCSTNVQEPEANPSSWAMKDEDSETSVKQSLAMETAHRGPSLDCEEPLANSSNLRTENGNVVAVMDSDDDDEDDIRPVGKASSRRRQALSSPCSQGFKMPANPGKQRDNNQRNGLSSRHLQVGSESDDEFESDKSATRSRSESVKTVQVKARAQKRNSLDISAKQGTRKSLDSFRKKNSKRFRNNHFLDDEAELSGSDINDFSSDETDGEDEDEMDSFIDDATQLTQRTPSTTKPRPASSPVDMMAVYRQSLMSPLCGALNFRTPAFHKQRNKYKMVYKYRGVEEDSQSASEAEETNESESFLENEGEAEDENEAEIEYESEACRRSSDSAQANAHASADLSFNESQIRRPVKRMKRKRILDDSFGEVVSPRLSNQRNFSETCDKKSVLENNAMAFAESNKAPMGEAQQWNSGAFGSFLKRPTAVGRPFQCDFVKSSEALANKNNLHDKTSTLRRSEVSKGSMRRSGAFIDEWNNDISDSELLVALEDKVEQVSINRTSEKSSKPQSNDKFHDQDFNENLVAMDMTNNDDVSIKTSTPPNFSLGFDFLWEVSSMNSESEEGRNSAKENTVTFLKQMNENYTSSVNRHNGTGFPNFTKITQHSGHNSDISCRESRDQHTENKVNVKQMSCSTSDSTKAVPQKVTNSSISSGRSVVSDQNQAFNKSLATQNRSSSHNTNAQAKLQVVTPSCRPNDIGTRPAVSPLLTSSLRDKGKIVILVDTREITSSQVVSLLRLKHNIKAEVCQLTSCDYIVSNRMAVKRKTASDVANGANSQKLVECIRRMCDLYDRPCLIIEKDRVKPGETEKHFIKTKAYILTLASVAQTHVKIIFSENQEETARLLTDLADIETKKGTAITACTALSKEREQVFRVVQSIPRVSYVTALNLCSSFNTLQEIVHSTAAELERRTPGLSNPRAAEIHKYLRHKFNSDMLAAKK